jgi:hypothetical protein
MLIKRAMLERIQRGEVTRPFRRWLDGTSGGTLESLEVGYRLSPRGRKVFDFRRSG